MFTQNLIEISTGITYLPHIQLAHHPHNVRRFYAEPDIKSTAKSIAAASGVDQALLITPAVSDNAPLLTGDGAPVYWVVDGNMRLRGAALLGAAAPLLKCEVIGSDHAEQMMIMIRTGTTTPKDPISEALHYQYLIEQMGENVLKISRRTGVAQTTIAGRLKLLDLDEPIQQLVGQGQFSKDPRVAEALLAIENTGARIKLAQTISARKLTAKAAIAAAERLKAQLEATPPASATHPTPMVRHTRASNLPQPKAPVFQPPLKTAVSAMCQACDMRELPDLKGWKVPAWEIVAQTANGICHTCQERMGRAVPAVCQQCPGVAMLRGLIEVLA